MILLPYLPGCIVILGVTEKKMEPQSLVVNDIWIQRLYVVYLKIWITFRPSVAELYLYPPPKILNLFSILILLFLF